MTVISSSLMSQLSYTVESRVHNILYTMAYKGPCTFYQQIPTWLLVASCPWDTVFIIPSNYGGFLIVLHVVAVLLENSTDCSEYLDLVFFFKVCVCGGGTGHHPPLPYEVIN